MNITTAGYLVIYGISLILLGVIGYLTHPEKAFTALISGGGFGALSILWGILGAKGLRWPRLAALLTSALLAIACVWRVTVVWVAVVSGQSEKLFAAIVVTLMLIVSILTLGLLRKGRTSSAAHPPAGGES
jgi:hypothetical protein